MFVDPTNGRHVAVTGLRLAQGAKSLAGCARVRSLDIRSVIVTSVALAILATIAPSKSLAQSITVFNYVPGVDVSLGSATGISADGSTVVGYNASSLSSPFEAFRWTQASGVVGLGFASGFANNNFAMAVNSDGTVVVGYGNSNTQIQGFDGPPRAGSRVSALLLVMTTTRPAG
jgi:uncharacterized membrane protein